MNNDIKLEEEKQDSYSDDSLFNITSWGADFSFREIVERYEDGEIIKPELQRKYVWSKKDASRFVDSILLGLPVPSIFFSKTNNESLLIIDGYQRIMTIHDYIQGFFSDSNDKFNLTNSKIINKQWRGKTFKELSIEEQRRIKNSTIHAIIFQQKYPSNDTGMYQIFERLNNTGRTLKSQEIRNCVYYGEFNTLVNKLNKNEDWRTIMGVQKEDSRMADIELILRFFAIRDLYNQIIQSKIKIKQIILTKYLNEYMGIKQNIDENEQKELENIFERVVSFFSNSLGKNTSRNFSNDNFTNKIHPAIFDAIMVACSYCIENNYNLIIHNLEKKYINLLSKKEFINSIKEQTTKIENIKTRIELAIKVLFG